MADSTPELTRLQSYLGLKPSKVSFDGKEKVPVLKAQNVNNVKGLVTISKFLTRQSGKQDILLGYTHEEQAAISQWLEYRVTCLDCANTKQDINTCLMELNKYLEDKVYILGNRLTLADIVLYYGLHKIYAELSFHEKELNLNVSRWFNNIQRTSNLQQDLSDVIFSRTLLYKGILVH